MTVANTQSTWWGNLYCLLHAAIRQGYRTCVDDKVKEIYWVCLNLDIRSPFGKYSAEETRRFNFARVVILSTTTSSLLDLITNGAAETKIVKHVTFCRITKLVSEMYPAIALQPNLGYADERVKTQVKEMIQCASYFQTGVIKDEAIIELNVRMAGVHQYSVLPATFATAVGVAELRKKIEATYCDLGQFLVNHSSMGFDEKTSRLRIHYINALNNSKALITP